MKIVEKIYLLGLIFGKILNQMLGIILAWILGRILGKMLGLLLDNAWSIMAFSRSCLLKYSKFW